MNNTKLFLLFTLNIYGIKIEHGHINIQNVHIFDLVIGLLNYRVALHWFTRGLMFQLK